MRSISKTITVATILWTGLILALGQIALDKTVSSWLESQFDLAIESKARALVTLTNFQNGRVELNFADEFMPEFETRIDPEYFELFLADGSLLERSNSFDGHPESVFPDQLDERVVSDVRLPDGRAGRQISIRFVPQIEDETDNPGEQRAAQTTAQNRPEAILRISRERGTLDRSRQLLHALVLGITLCILLAVVVGVPRLTRAGLRPLLRMKSEISQITSQSIDRRITSEGQPEEIEPIARQFNLALDEIEKAFIRERQFSSDVAHELRTPVAEIRSLAEVGLRWPDEKDMQSYFGDIHESARHLDRLIENLLYLSRSEEGLVDVVMDEVDLGELIEETRLSLDIERKARNITLNPPRFDLPVVVADPQWLRLILRNLLFNAISYGPQGSTVTIDAVFDADQGSLEVHNPMEIPLTSDDIGKIFQRFWRKDTARESGHHAGIGLALVKNYAGLMDIGIKAWIQDASFHIKLTGIKVAKIQESTS